MAQDKKQTDVLVVGWTLAGAVAATALAQAGREVLVVDSADDTHYELGDSSLPIRLAEPRVPAGAAVRHVLRQLGLEASLSDRGDTWYRDTTPQPDAVPTFQVDLPEGRLDLGISTERDRRELLRELPGATGFLETLDGVGGEMEDWLRDWTLRDPEGSGRDDAPEQRWAAWTRALRRHCDPGDVRDRLLAASTAVLPLRPDSVNLGCAARLWWRLLRGAAPGVDELLRALRLRFTDGGGRWLTPAADYRIQTRWGRPQELSTRELEVRFETLLWALPLTQLVERADARWLTFGLRKQVTASPPVEAHRLVLNLAIRQEGIPDAMGRCLFLSDAEPAFRRPTLWIRCERPSEERSPVLLTVQSTAQIRAPREGLVAHRDRILDRLRSLLPFLDEHLLWHHSPNLREPPGGAHPPVTGTLIPAPREALHALPESHRGFTLCPLKPGPRGLIAASRETYPGLGAEGELLAGWQAAALAHAAPAG
ncbi:MAG: hypothetical protein ABI333_06110 [bacterium]